MSTSPDGAFVAGGGGGGTADAGGAGAAVVGDGRGAGERVVVVRFGAEFAGAFEVGGELVAPGTEDELLDVDDVDDELLDVDDDEDVELLVFAPRLVVLRSPLADSLASREDAASPSTPSPVSQADSTPTISARLIRIRTGRVMSLPSTR